MVYVAVRSFQSAFVSTSSSSILTETRLAAVTFGAAAIGPRLAFSINVHSVLRMFIILGRHRIRGGLAEWIFTESGPIPPSAIFSGWRLRLILAINLDTVLELSCFPDIVIDDFDDRLTILMNNYV